MSVLDHSWPARPPLARRIFADHDITAGGLLEEFARRDQVIQDALGHFGILHLVLQGHYLVLHLVELCHLQDDGIIFDLLLELLSLDLSLGAPSLGADLEHVGPATVRFYTNEEENELS